MLSELLQAEGSVLRALEGEPVVMCASRHGDADDDDDDDERCDADDDERVRWSHGADDVAPSPAHRRVF